jgi:molybdenum cofactor cytidylyltransferase
VLAEGGIAAVVLAAGASRRFGTDNKLLARVTGRTLIERVVDALADGGIDEVIVVTGCDRPGIEAALGARPVRFVHNADWESGMGSSVGAGIAAVSPGASGAFVVPGDMPFLSRALIVALIEAFEASGGGRAVYPATETGEQRNPVLWPRRYFDALRALPPEVGAKMLLQQADATPVTFAHEAAWLDVDTQDDLAAARENGSD